jgi:hypothetical protein
MQSATRSGGIRTVPPGAKQFITDFCAEQSIPAAGSCVKLPEARITIETHQVVVVRRRRVVRFWCGQCGRKSEFVPVEDLNGLLEVGANGVVGQALSTEIHVAKSRDGAVVVCINSLSGPS